jgi:triose/dihydroxyacetone kinase / FAD-AMP lyase (cyclizing)
VAAKDGASWPKALEAGLAKVRHYGGAKAGDRTMIDALEPALAALVAGKTLKQAAEAARKGADATKSMKAARAGRSAYVSAKNLDGIADPGAEAVARLFAALSAR